MRQVATCNETIHQSPNRSDLLYPQGPGWVSSENHLHREIMGFEGCFTSLQSITAYAHIIAIWYTADISRCWFKFTLGEQSCFGLGSCTNWARHIRNVRIKRKRRVVRRTSTYLKASCLNVFWAYWCILWLWKNPTLMRFQARHACCSYPESLPLENNSTNCSMYAMITSVLSNRNHPSFITLLGPEVFNLPGLWFKVQTIRKAKL